MSIESPYKIAAANAGWRLQFRFAVDTGWSGMAELIRSATTKT
jgi:hypothetical protein